MSETEVLAANETFYRAFAGRDVPAMDALWARARPVACIHPGWGPLTTRDAVMESWQAILTGRNAPRIVCAAPRAYLLGDTAFVTCFEAVGNAFLIATNIFAREDGQWRMVHHQAGPTNDAPPEPEPAPEPEKKTVH
jgi:hypothetical protein